MSFGQKPSHDWTTAASTVAHWANSVASFPPRPARIRAKQMIITRGGCELVAVKVSLAVAWGRARTELLGQEQVDDARVEQRRLPVHHEARQAERVLLLLRCT